MVRETKAAREGGGALILWFGGERRWNTPQATDAWGCGARYVKRRVRARLSDTRDSSSVIEGADGRGGGEQEEIYASGRHCVLFPLLGLRRGRLREKGPKRAQGTRDRNERTLYALQAADV